MTLVVHGLWRAGSLVLWAEDPERYDALRPRGTRSRAKTVAHPFAADVDGLLVELAVDGEVLTATLQLPTAAGRPVASPDVATTDVGGRVGMAPWEVPAVALSPPEALDLLLRGPTHGRTTDSVSWLTTVAELALELLARGRVLPALDEVDGRWRAVWRTVVLPDDVARIRALDGAMPAICRAAGVDLRSVVDALADATVRDALANDPLLERRRRRRVGAQPVAEAWLDALSGEPSVEGDRHELAKLAASVDEWRASARRGEEALRLCFRLSPPPDPDPNPDPQQAHLGPVDAAEPWTLEFLLQSADDPSLMVAAAEVWVRNGRGRRALARVDRHPEERLLAGLGRAVRLYPDLEPALDTERPSGLELDAIGAARFLRDHAPVLDQAGFGVIVPSWWRSRRRHLGARLRASTPSPTSVTGAGIGMHTLVDYQWEIALGDEALSAAELRRLARLKQPLVRVRGEWVELHEDDLRAALRLLEQRAAAVPMTAAEVLQAAVGLGADPGLPVLGVEAEGWLGDLLGQADDRVLEPVPTPADFCGTLRPYQERGLSWLMFLGRLGLGACLADDMGLGKTAQLLALVLADKTTTPTLVVCPMSLVGNWQREASRFAPSLRVHVHHGAKRTTGAAFVKATAKAELVLTTYSLAARDAELLGGIAWGRVVIDEAQNIKNSGARQTKAVRSLPAAQRVAMTGTPVENRLSDLWSILEFANPGLLGSERAFRERFAIPVERYGDDEAAETLRTITAPFVLRRLKTDKTIIADLPDKLEMRVFCNLTREQATLYQAVVDDMLAKVEASEGIARRGLVLATMLKLKQVCNHPAQLLGDGSRIEGRSGKLARLTETLEEVVAEGDRALVFTQFAEMGTLLHSQLRPHLAADVLWLHGGTPKAARDQMVARFQDGTGPAVFLLSLKAGGSGLNLTAANHVVHFDRWWNPAVEDQATDRAFRIGQRRDVQVRKLVCVGTLEERIDAMIETKRALAERIVGTGESWLTELSTDALREILALSPDAVAEG